VKMDIGGKHGIDLMSGPRATSVAAIGNALSWANWRTRRNRQLTCCSISMTGSSVWTR